MPPQFIARSERIQRSTGSLLSVGLDPDRTRMPRPLRGLSADKALGKFLAGVIDATRPYASAYKFQLHAYWAYGPAGFVRLKEAVDAIGPDRLRILDLKANDVPNTMRLLREGVFSEFGFDAVTVTPWLGWETLETFTEDSAHGFYIVAHSSNPGSRDLQDPPRSRRPPWLEVLRRARGLAARSHNAGVVLGATYPEAVALARRRLGPHVPILLPGIGAQQGELESAVAGGVDASGGALVVNASRSVLYASEGSDWKLASGREAGHLRDAINAARRGAPRRSRRSAR